MRRLRLYDQKLHIFGTKHSHSSVSHFVKHLTAHHTTVLLAGLDLLSLIFIRNSTSGIVEKSYLLNI